jgi:hypothetical protein
MQEENFSTKARRASKEVLISSIKSAFGMVPVIGTALDQIVFEYGNRIKAARLERFIEHLSAKVQHIDEAKLNHEYLLSEDFYDITQNIVDKAFRSKSSIKHQMLAQILLDSINQTVEIDESLTDVFINYVDSLKPIQIKMLLYFSNKVAELEEIGSYSNLYELYTSENPEITIAKDEFKLFCSNLENKALISTGNGLDDFDAVGGFIALQSYKSPSLRVTSVGTSFLQYIKEV